MAAFYGTGVDNALVEIDQEEVPIMDGSSKVFVEAIKNSGLREFYYSNQNNKSFKQGRNKR